VPQSPQAIVKMNEKAELRHRSKFAVFFWIKVFIAIGVAVGGIVLMELKIHDKHIEALKYRPARRFDFSPGSPECRSTNNPLGRLVAPSQKMMFGYHIDWSINVAKDTQDNLGYRPNIINSFIKYDVTTNPKWDINMMNWQASEVAKLGSGVIFAITLEFVTTMDRLQDSDYNAIATEFARINKEFGLPIMVRWGHEMNGDWTIYGIV
jgi:hypothetical protein